MKLVLQEKFYDPYAEFQRKDSSSSSQLDASSSRSELEAWGAAEEPPKPAIPSFPHLYELVFPKLECPEDASTEKRMAFENRQLERERCGKFGQAARIPERFLEPGKYLHQMQCHQDLEFKHSMLGSLEDLHKGIKSNPGEKNSYVWLEVKDLIQANDTMPNRVSLVLTEKDEDILDRIRNDFLDEDNPDPERRIFKSAWWSHYVCEVEGHHEVVYVMDSQISLSKEGGEERTALKDRMQGGLVFLFFNGWPQDLKPGRPLRVRPVDYVKSAMLHYRTTCQIHHQVVQGTLTGPVWDILRQIVNPNIGPGQHADEGLKPSSNSGAAGAFEHVIASVPGGLSAIQGPPGTGKSTAIKRIVQDRVPEGQKALVTCVKNKAVDALVEKLKDLPGSIVVFGGKKMLGPDAVKYTLERRARGHTETLRWNEILRALERLRKSFEDGVLVAFDWCQSPGPKRDANTSKNKQANNPAPAVDDLFDSGTAHTKGNSSDRDSADEDAMFWKGGNNGSDELEDMDYTKAAKTAQEGNRPQNSLMVSLFGPDSKLRQGRKPTFFRSRLQLPGKHPCRTKKNEERNKLAERWRQATVKIIALRRMALLHLYIQPPCKETLPVKPVPTAMPFQIQVKNARQDALSRSSSSRSRSSESSQQDSAVWIEEIGDSSLEASRDLGRNNHATGSAVGRVISDSELEIVASSSKDDPKALLEASSIQYSAGGCCSWMGPLEGLLQLRDALVLLCHKHSEPDNQHKREAEISLHNLVKSLHFLAASFLKLRAAAVVHKFKLDDLQAYVHFLASTVGGKILPLVLDHAKREILMEASAYLSTIDSVPTIFKQATQCNASVEPLIRTVVVDEAGCMPEYQMPLLLSNSPVTNLVLVGDHHQLPCFSRMSERTQARLGVVNHSRSLLKRIVDCGVVVPMFVVQYRMVKPISDVVSCEFYNGRLQTAASVPRQSKKQSMKWVEVPMARSSSTQTVERYESNPLEAKKAIAEAVAAYDKLLNQGNLQPSVYVITPYNKQVEALEKELKAVRAARGVQLDQEFSRLRINCKELEEGYTPNVSSRLRHADFLDLLNRKNKQALKTLMILTVDKAQGSESDVVVLSTVKCGLFTRDSRRMCVALSRAKKLCILVGNTNEMQQDPMWARIISAYSKV